MSIDVRNHRNLQTHNSKLAASLHKEHKVRFSCKQCAYTAAKASTLERHARKSHGGCKTMSDVCSKVSQPRARKKLVAATRARVRKCHKVVGKKHKKLVGTTDTLPPEDHCVPVGNKHQNPHPQGAVTDASVTQLDHQLPEDRISGVSRDSGKVTSSNQGISCEICHRHFQQRIGLARHMRVHRRKSDVQMLPADSRKKFACKRCGFKASGSFCMARHLLREHGSQSYEAELDHAADISDSYKSKGEEESCHPKAENRRRRNGNTQSAWKNLIEKGQSEGCSVESEEAGQNRTGGRCVARKDAVSAESITDDADGRGPAADRTLLHDCKICGRHFSTFSGKSLHLVMHSGITFVKCHTTADKNCTTFSCSSCNFVAADENTLFRHLRSLHVCFEVQATAGGQSTYCCSKCDFTSVRRVTMINHLRNFHGLTDFQIVLGTEATVPTESDVEIMDKNVNESQPKPNGVATTEEIYECSLVDIEDATLKKWREVLESTQTVSSKDESGQQPVGAHSDDKELSLQPNSKQDEVSSSDTSKGEVSELPSKSRMYKCKICNWQFRQLRGLTSHMKVHCGKKQMVDGELKFCCKVCDFMSAHSFHFVRHVLRVHGPQGFSSHQGREVFDEAYSDGVAVLPHMPSLSASVSLHDMMDVNPNSNKCKVCGKKYCTVTTLMRHIREVHHGSKCNNTNEKSNRRDYRKCPKCNKILQSATTLLVHMKRHDPEQPVFQCNKCGRCLKTASTLKLHKRNLHSDDLERSFICKTCGRALRTMVSLTTHELIHSGEKPHCCEVCGMQFRQLAGLLVHKRIHTGEKPFPCSQCGKTFRASSQRKEHIIVMHTDSKPFSCPHCPLTFGLGKAMRRHIKDRHGAGGVRPRASKPKKILRETVA